MIDLDMGAYAAFVWPAWGVSAAVLGALALRAVIASRRWNAELKRLDKDATKS
jgi:heme exporter protein D